MDYLEIHLVQCQILAISEYVTKVHAVCKNQEILQIIVTEKTTKGYRCYRRKRQI